MLSSPGIGSGLNVDGIVSQLMALEKRPLSMLASREGRQQAQLSAFGRLEGALSTLQASVKALTHSTTFNDIKASLADTTIASVSAATNATAGKHKIEVLTLAQSQKIKSGNFAQTSATLGSGTLTIAFGTYHGDGSFTANPDKAARTITIGAGQSSLVGVRDAINHAQAGVTASIVNDGSGHRLVIASNDTGLSNALRITVSDADGNNTDNAGLSRLAFDASIGGVSHLAETVAARNATLTINGIAISRSSNTISDALEGVTLNLLRANPGNLTSLSVSRDTGSTQRAVEAFIKSYNDLNQTINSLSRFDATSRQASVLTGDSTLRTVQSQVRRLLTSTFPAGEGGFATLSQIGVNFQKDGALTLDNRKFNEALNTSPGGVAALFSRNFAPSLDQAVDGMLKTNGLIDSRMNGINTAIKEIGRQRDAIGRRLEETEKRFRAQFAALDAMIASMSQTSNFLRQQLANLPRLNDK